MNDNMVPDIDPLSTYSLSTYSNYENFENNPYSASLTYQYPVKSEQYQNNFHLYSNVPQTSQSKYSPAVSNIVTSNDTRNKTNVEPQPSIDNNNDKQKTKEIQEDVKPDIINNGKGNLKKERSKYFSVKITEKNFPFYGCSVCNICFQTLTELDTHVLIHKDRITSYDLRIKNQIKKKKLKKEMKKNKKKKKNAIKKEMNVEVEIKPEEGYIGNEKASNFMLNNESDNQSSKENNENLKSNETESKVTDETTPKLTESSKKQVEDLQKIYKCFACQKQFTLSYYLKLHVRSHTDEKPYTCAECGQSFITASKLGRHNKRFHLAIRYQCRICYRYFSRFEFLTRHFDKKHPDDKLEGEPYDYNAILPYLKELEEQLREKNESENTKQKSEELLTNDWPDIPTNDSDSKDIVVKAEQIDIPISFDSVDVKEEADFDDRTSDGCKEDLKDGDFDSKEDLKDEDVKDDCQDDFKDNDQSDDDYFPSNTWAATPKIDPPSPNTTDKLKCPVCEKKVSTASYMRIHMRTHTGEKPFKCYICNMGFITSSKMHRHVLTHPKDWDEDEVKHEKVDLKVETEENGGDNVTADKKTKKSQSKLTSKKTNNLEKKKKLYQKRPHACEFCNKRFLHFETLQVHKKSHEGESIVYKCNYCLEEQLDEGALKTHEATHTGPKPYLCTVCGKGYKKRETMIYHRKNHKPDKEYICDICTKTFNAQCKLQRHIVSHRVDKYVLRYECPVCAHMFNTKYHVQMHLATHQKEGLIQEENRNEILAMVLQNARKIPKTPDAQSSLTDIVPSDERSRVCNICGEVFQHFYYLEEHLKSHGSKIAIEDSESNEEKKHICKICNKAFKLHYYLKLHSFTHTKEKPFICQQCGKGFITRGKLKRHLETHTGLKKYQCHICYKFFTRPSYLRIHVRTIHGTQDYNFRLEKQYGLSFAPVMGHGV